MGHRLLTGTRFSGKILTGAALLPESTRNRMVTIAAQRLPTRGLPHCGHCPQGTRTSIGASYALIMSKWSSARTYLALWTEWSTPTPSPTRFGNGPKLAIAHARGNRTHRPDHTGARIIRLTPVTARGLGPPNRGTLQRDLHQQSLTIVRLNRLHTRNRTITARRGMTWTIQPATADMKLSDRKPPQQSRSVVTPSLPSHAVIIKSGLLLRPCEADTFPCMPFRTPTHQTLKPAFNGLTPRARHHARLLPEQRILSRDTSSAAPPDSRNPHTATMSRSRLQPIRPNLNPRHRETRLTPGLPHQETSTTIARSLLLPPKTSWITRSLQSST